LSDEQLQKLVEDAVMHAPTSFNMQQSRAVLVTGDMHQKVWDTVTECQTKTFDDGKSKLNPSTFCLVTVHVLVIGTIEAD
jgi:predicted oxidoreductase (fatty acid repression mutant protein)